MTLTSWLDEVEGRRKVLTERSEEHLGSIEEEVAAIQEAEAGILFTDLPRLLRLLRAAVGVVRAVESVRRLCAEQAEDEALWAIGDSIVEAYTQQELRRLTRAVEEQIPLALWDATLRDEGLEG